MDKARENFYKYLLFFKKYAKNAINTDSNDRLSVNPAIETILYSEKKIRDLSNSDKSIPIRAFSVRERDYYKNFSLKKSLDEFLKEYGSLSFFMKKRIENYSLPDRIVDNKGQINENLLFFKLLINDESLDNDSLKGTFNRYKNFKNKMSYSFFKSVFCLKNRNLEEFIFDEGYFNFLFNFYFNRNVVNSNGFFINYFSKMFFHLKNQFLNLHFSNTHVIDKLHDFFSLKFFMSKNNIEGFKFEEENAKIFTSNINQPNVFFPDLSTMDSKYLENKDKVSNLPVFKFMMQRYCYIGEKNLNSIIYSMYFPKSQIVKMFSYDKIKKDLGNYLRLLLKQNKPSLEDVKNIKQKMFVERSKIIAKIDGPDIREPFINVFFNEIGVKGETSIPYIGVIEFERKKLEDMVVGFKNKYQREGSSQNLLYGSLAKYKSLYKDKDVELLISSANIFPVIEFKEIFNNPRKKNPEKQIQR